MAKRERHCHSPNTRNSQSGLGQTQNCAWVSHTGDREPVPAVGQGAGSCLEAEWDSTRGCGSPKLCPPPGQMSASAKTTDHAHILGSKLPWSNKGFFWGGVGDKTWSILPWIHEKDKNVHYYHFYSYWYPVLTQGNESRKIRTADPKEKYQNPQCLNCQVKIKTKTHAHTYTHISSLAYVNYYIQVRGGKSC